MLDTYVSFMHSLRVTFVDKEGLKSKTFYFVGVDMKECVLHIYAFIDKNNFKLKGIEVIDNSIRVDVRIPAMMELHDAIDGRR